MTDVYVTSYADRIAEGLRADRYPNKLDPLEARLVASRYGVEVPHEPTTIRELSLLIAGRVVA